jgi:homocysteine S-methyltransferase
VNPENEIQRLKLKMKAGAEYMITQPVFDVDALKAFMEKVELDDLFLIAGIWPLVSLRNAEFMKNEVPGVSVPDEVIKTIAKFESKDDQLKAGIEIAQRMVDQVLGFVHGIQVSAPFGKYHMAVEVAGAILNQ